MDKTKYSNKKLKIDDIEVKVDVVKEITYDEAHKYALSNNLTLKQAFDALKSAE